VLALRIEQGLWGQHLPGDVLDAAGQPTGPLWGRGRVASTDQARALETTVAERHAALCDGLEHAGLAQERRALVVRPAGLAWAWPQAHQLVLGFELPAGAYATAVLNEIARTAEPERHTGTEPAADD
jgi:tRNA pseudouridine13 synthase